MKYRVIVNDGEAPFDVFFNGSEPEIDKTTGELAFYRGTQLVGAFPKHSWVAVFAVTDE